VFVALGLSGVIPAGHFVITDGLSHAFNYAALGWIMLMAFLYIIGAVIYAARVPERIWPGRFDIWVKQCLLCTVYVCGLRGLTIDKCPVFLLIQS